MAQRQYRSDDTDKWKYGFGNGSDGDLTISADTTEAPIDSTCSGTSGETSLTATNVNFATNQIILIHQTAGTGVGGWELNKILSYTSGTITLKHALTMTYTNSGSSQAQVRVLKQYNNVTINSGKTYNAKLWDSGVGGILGFLAKGTVNIVGTITASLKGFSGGGYNGNLNSNGWAGNGTAGPGGDSRSANGNAGGGGALGGTHTPGSGGGGGNAGVGGDGCAGDRGGAGGTGGNAVGTASLTNMNFGGSGGHFGTNTNYGQSGTYTSLGGGIVFILANVIKITGSIISAGGDGNNFAPVTAGDGSGAGGSILLKGTDITAGTNLITVPRGTPGFNSGYGSVGRIHVDYSYSLTGTSTPTIDTTKDTTILGINTKPAFLFNLASNWKNN